MELPDLGLNCSVCNRDDYLPFKCSHCDKIVCIDHKTNHGSACPLNRTHFEFDQDHSTESECLKKPCDFCRKITLKLELVECLNCHKSHCLYHRHQVQHNCPGLAADRDAAKQEKIDRSERQKAALEKLRSTVLKPVPNVMPPVKPTDPKKKELAQRVRLMRLKQSARGPPNILDHDKIFFEIKFSHEPSAKISDPSKDGKSIKIFTTAKHTIGRMIDWSSDELGVTNKNHLIDASQLAFKKQLDNGEFITLDSQVPFSQYLSLGQVDNGDEIVLTYISELQ